MDQIRKIMSWLKQQHFWVLSGLVAAIALFCWYSASSALVTEFQANESAIKSQFGAVDTAGNTIANDTINATQSKFIGKQEDEVKRIWQQLYERQREAVLEWPAALGIAFRDEVAELDFEDEIPREMRNIYMDYIDRYFPELPKKIGAREMAADASGFGGGYGGNMGRGIERGYGGEMNYSPTGELEEDDNDYLVQWLDQGRVRAEMTFQQRPTSLEIWVTQENLWVYETLLNIIRNTNAAKGSDRISNAAVRTIMELQVGQPAAVQAQAGGATANRLYMPPSAAPAMGGDMMGGRMAMGMEGGMPMGAEAGGMPTDGGYGGYDMRGGMGSEYGAMGMGGADQGRTGRLSNRYLDATGQPIPVASPTKGGPEEFGKEYKRLPIRMTLEMDLRWLSHLITECANQPLQVEVKEIRINPSDIGSMGGGGYGGGSGYRGGGGYGGGGGGSSPFGNDSQAGTIQTFPAHPNIGTVVIQGIIYIFNPPNMEAAAEATETVATMP
jgi:hypothetical protein